MSKGDLADDLAEKLGEIRDNLAAVLPDDNGQLATDLMCVRERTLNGLLDVLSVLRTQDEKLFEAFAEWIHEDAGGDTLMRTVPDRLGYHEWLKRGEEKGDEGDEGDAPPKPEQFYETVKHAQAMKVNDVERERAVRLYCYTSGASWCLQVRAPVMLADRSDGKDFVVATAHLDKATLVALRESIDAHLRDAAVWAAVWSKK